MYVITDHNNQNFVILGPIEWKARYISDILSDEFDDNITVTKDDELRVPFEVIPGVKVRKCVTSFEEINPKINRHEGPFWVYDDANTEIQAVANWIKVDKPIDFVKSDLKSQLANLRWQKENKGVELTIQDAKVWCDTSRGNRDIFIQKYSIMSDTDTVMWKFPGDIWLNLTKSDLGYIVSEGSKYIQSCFDWEAAKAAGVDACTTLEQLDQFVLEDG